MTMHLARGLTTLNTKKPKKKKMTLERIAKYQADLKKHNKDTITNDVEEPVKCSECSVSFINQVLMTKHCIAEHDSRTLCIICRKKFSNVNNLRTHVNILHRKMNYRCRFCDFESSDKQSLTSHLNDEHVKEKLKCNECEYRTFGSANLKAHKTDKHEMAKCNKCDAVFSSRYQRSVHYNAKHRDRDDKKETIKCDECDYSATKYFTYRKHVKEKHEIGRVQCDQCIKDFASKNNLDVHMKSVHKN